MISPRRPQGFTLAELLVAVTLMAVVLAGLFALQDTLLRDQGKVLREIAVRNQADFIRRQVLRDIEQASVIQSPAVNSTSKDLIGFKNLDPFNVRCDCAGGVCLPDCLATTCPGTGVGQPGSRWISFTDLPKDAAGLPDPNGGTAADGLRQWGNDTTWFRYCLTTDNRLMYLRGRMLATNSVTCPITGTCGCGAVASPNCVEEEVAGGPVGVFGGFGTAGDLFSRGDRQDAIDVDIQLATTTWVAGLSQGTSVQVVLRGQLLRGIR